MKLRVHSVPWGLFACAAGACAPAASEPEPGAAVEPLESLAVVELHRTEGDDADQHVLVRAAFARFRGVTGDAVLGLVGARPSTDVETCQLAADAEMELGSAAAHVELLDAGPIEIAWPGATARVQPKTFPELGDVVSGAFYAEDVPRAAVTDERGDLTITALGGQLAGLRAQVTEPAELRDVFVDGIGLSDRVALRRGNDLELFWLAGDVRDRVTVELVAGGRVMQCVARDDGAFRIPSDVTMLLDLDPAGRVEVRRVRAHAIDVGGMDLAWIALSTGRTATLSVE